MFSSEKICIIPKPVFKNLYLVGRVSVFSKWPWSSMRTSNWLEDLDLCLNVALRCLLESFHMGRLAVPGQVLLLRVLSVSNCETVDGAGWQKSPELPKSQSWRNCLNRLLLPPCTAGSGCTLAQPAKYPTTFKQLHPRKTFLIFFKRRTFSTKKMNIKLYLGGLYNLGCLLQKSGLILHLESSVHPNLGHSWRVSFSPSRTNLLSVEYSATPPLNLAWWRVLYTTLLGIL